MIATGKRFKALIPFSLKMCHSSSKPLRKNMHMMEYSKPTNTQRSQHNQNNRQTGKRVTSSGSRQDGDDVEVTEAEVRTQGGGRKGVFQNRHLKLQKSGRKVGESTTAQAKENMPHVEIYTQPEKKKCKGSRTSSATSDLGLDVSSKKP